MTSETNDIYEYKFEELDLDSPLTVLKQEDNALVYVLGASLHKARHTKCRQNLIADENKNLPTNEDYAFTSLKTKLSYRNATIPNNTL